MEKKFKHIRNLFLRVFMGIYDPPSPPHQQLSFRLKHIELETCYIKRMSPF